MSVLERVAAVLALVLIVACRDASKVEQKQQATAPVATASPTTPVATSPATGNTAAGRAPARPLPAAPRIPLYAEYTTTILSYAVPTVTTQRRPDGSVSTTVRSSDPPDAVSETPVGVTTSTGFLYQDDTVVHRGHTLTMTNPAEPGMKGLTRTEEYFHDGKTAQTLSSEAGARPVLSISTRASSGAGGAGLDFLAYASTNARLLASARVKEALPPDAPDGREVTVESGNGTSTNAHTFLRVGGGWALRASLQIAEAQTGAESMQSDWSDFVLVGDSYLPRVGRMVHTSRGKPHLVREFRLSVCRVPTEADAAKHRTFTPPADAVRISDPADSPGGGAAGAGADTTRFPLPPGATPAPH